jgi:hypothetical protein
MSTTPQAVSSEGTNGRKSYLLRQQMAICALPRLAAIFAENPLVVVGPLEASLMMRVAPSKARRQRLLRKALCRVWREVIKSRGFPSVLAVVRPQNRSILFRRQTNRPRQASAEQDVEKYSRRASRPREMFPCQCSVSSRPHSDLAITRTEENERTVVTRVHDSAAPGSSPCYAVSRRGRFRCC